MAGHVTVVVREALIAVASPDKVEVILDRALNSAALSAIPEVGSEIRIFIEGYLLPSVAEVIDAPAAEMVAETLAPVIAIADVPGARVRPVSGEIARADYLRAATMPAPSKIPSILVVTRDQTTMQQLFDALSRDAIVHHAPTPASVGEALRANTIDVVLLDLRSPGNTAIAPRALSARLGGPMQVLLWGGTHASIADVPEDDAHWHGCARDTTMDEVAHMCLTLTPTHRYAHLRVV